MSEGQRDGVTIEMGWSRRTTRGAGERTCVALHVAATGSRERSIAGEAQKAATDDAEDDEDDTSSRRMRRSGVDGSEGMGWEEVGGGSEEVQESRSADRLHREQLQSSAVCPPSTTGTTTLLLPHLLHTVRLDTSLCLSLTPS